jgi:eukaryotic-like serine/threonine-protein kinase
MEEGKLLAGRYRARALLRRGGMGEVWRCLDTEQGREVAVKAVLPEFLREPWTARLFHNEVTAVAHLNHPGIVPVCDLVSDEEGTYLVMELVPGVPLSDIVAARPSWGLIRTVLEQILGALAYAHARGILHLDIKPANAMVDTRGAEIARIA